jgi:hypothetical protein
MISTLLGETVHVALARAKVAAFDCVLKQAVDAVAVVAIILCGINPTLGCDGVCAAGAVVKRKAFDTIALLAERGGGRSPANPAPTTMIECLRRLAGFTSLNPKINQAARWSVTRS